MGNKIKTEERIGCRFGKLVILRISKRKKVRKGSRTIVECRCDCGTVKDIDISLLTRKRMVKSCGCVPRVPNSKKTHGMSKTSEYLIYNLMKTRCYNHNYKEFYLYGGRGIKVCDRWLESFENFYFDMGKRPPNLSLDRINNNGNYEPSNCRWTTAKVQANNRRQARTAKPITYNGETMLLPDWCKKLGLILNTIYGRMTKNGLTFEQAIHKKKNTMTHYRGVKFPLQFEEISKNSTQ